VLVAAINAHLMAGGMAVIATHVPMALEPMQHIRLGRATTAEVLP
jgi:ABC-type transport system involved in cytochrome c biogenesis ATPase subunit